jgi:hypothetical protein
VLRLTVKVTLESDQHQAIQSEGQEISRLTVRKSGQTREYLLHLRTMLDGVLQSAGISDISGPCTSCVAFACVQPLKVVCSNGHPLLE